MFLFFLDHEVHCIRWHRPGYAVITNTTKAGLAWDSRVYFFPLLHVSHGWMGILISGPRLTDAPFLWTCGWTEHWLSQLLPKVMLRLHSHLTGQASSAGWGDRIMPQRWGDGTECASVIVQAATCSSKTLTILSFFLYSWCFSLPVSLSLTLAVIFTLRTVDQTCSFVWWYKGTVISPALVPWMTSTSAVPRSSTGKFCLTQ